MQKVGNRKFSCKRCKSRKFNKLFKIKNNYSKKTLSGCIIQKINNSVIIYSEKTENNLK